MRANTTTPYATYIAHEIPARPALGTRYARNVALFCAAPFIGLGFAVVGPLVGLGALAWVGIRALAAHWPRATRVALFLAAPFIGLGYALAAPFVGLGAIAWLGLEAARHRHAA